MSEKKVTPTHFRRLIARPPADLALLLAHVETLQRVSRRVHQCIPPLLQGHCRVANYKNHVLILHAETPAWTTRVRFLLPELQKKLADNSLFENLTEIQVRTEPQSAERAAPQRRVAISSASAAVVKSLAEGIPDPALQAALLRLANRATQMHKKKGQT